MSRSVEHVARPDGLSCSCGARFKSKAKLRKHVAPEREVWINTRAPVNPHKKARR